MDELSDKDIAFEALVTCLKDAYVDAGEAGNYGDIDPDSVRAVFDELRGYVQSYGRTYSNYTDLTIDVSDAVFEKMTEEGNPRPRAEDDYNRFNKFLAYCFGQCCDISPWHNASTPRGP